MNRLFISSFIAELSIQFVLDNLLLLTKGLYCNTNFRPSFTGICTDSRESSAGRVTTLLAGRPKNRDLIPAGTNLLFIPEWTHRIWGHSATFYWIWGFTPEIKWPGSDVGHSQPLSVKVRNKCICTSTLAHD